jgi:hypothetical protein
MAEDDVGALCKLRNAHLEVLNSCRESELEIALAQLIAIVLDRAHISDDP